MTNVVRCQALVVGAGAAGLAAASKLARAGVEVVVVDKGRGVGGRLATRRIGAARLDHGAQFFTVRGEPLASLVRTWLEADVVRLWCRGFGAIPDGHPRYVGRSGMTALAKDLARDLRVELGWRVTSLARQDATWVAQAERSDQSDQKERLCFVAGAAVLTPPAPQSLALLTDLDLSPRALDSLSVISFSPTLAALFVTEAPVGLEAPGAARPEGSVVSWLADNQAKGISEVPALTVHASDSWSLAHFGDPEEQVLERIWVEVGSLLPLPPDEHPVARQLARWRYATPRRVHPDPCLVLAEGPGPLICAGDAFGEPRVEGALNSGWAAADSLLERL